MLTKEQKNLIELIGGNLNASQISEQLGITNLQLFKRITNLEKKGYVITRKYYSDGSISYSLGKSKIDYDNTIITKPNENEMDILVVSDPHLGTKKEGLAELDRAYNYAVKNGIHVVFNCGDFVEGTFGRNDTKFKDPLKQVDYLIKNYPSDKSIVTFGVLGNHDVSIFYDYGLDIKELLKSYRHDLIVNYDQISRIAVKNDNICLFHSISQNYSNFKNDNSSLILKGHYHAAKFYPSGSSSTKAFIDVPALCRFNDDLPSAIRMKIIFKDNVIKRVELKQVLFLDKDYEINEIDYNLADRTLLEKKGSIQNYSFEQNEVQDEIVETTAIKEETVPVKTKAKEAKTVSEASPEKSALKKVVSKKTSRKKQIAQVLDTIDSLSTGLSIDERVAIIEDTSKPKKVTKKKKVEDKTTELTNEEKIALLVNSDITLEETPKKLKKESPIDKFNRKYGL